MYKLVILDKYTKSIIEEQTTNDINALKQLTKKYFENPISNTYIKTFDDKVQIFF